MKILSVLVICILLGLAISHVGGPELNNLANHEELFSSQARSANTDPQPGKDSAPPSPAVNLMQTDIALCDQPYFIELYELGVMYFSVGPDQAQEKEFAEIVFDHARNSGHFTEQEAETWIHHISNIPLQLVEIYREDPTLFDSCYNFQVAVVGPPP